MTFNDGRVGRIEDNSDEIVELMCSSMREYFEKAGSVEATGRRHALEDVTLRAPLVPKKFIHTSGNFRGHIDEAAKSGWIHPIYPWVVFFQNVDAIVGPDEPVVYPEGMTNELDYELELAVVIGKSGSFISPEEATDFIAGYTIFNDITARDVQREESRSGIFAMGKSIQTFCPLGPWIVTPDVVGDPKGLQMELRVNGDVRQQAPLSSMSVTLAELISHHSPMGYSVGDIISTGTPAGVAGFSDDPAAHYLKPGDVIEAEIDKIGVLRSPVIAWREAHPDLPNAVVGA